MMHFVWIGVENPESLRKETIAWIYMRSDFWTSMCKRFRVLKIEKKATRKLIFRQSSPLYACDESNMSPNSVFPAAHVLQLMPEPTRKLGAFFSLPQRGENDLNIRKTTSISVFWRPCVFARRQA